MFGSVLVSVVLTFPEHLGGWTTGYVSHSVIQLFSILNLMNNVMGCGRCFPNFQGRLRNFLDMVDSRTNIRYGYPIS